MDEAAVDLVARANKIVVLRHSDDDPRRQRLHAALRRVVAKAADAERYPDLASEPAAAVFALGDGLEPYRRLLASCTERLDDDAAVLIQLRGRVFEAARAELPVLRTRLERSASGPRFVPNLAAA